VTLRNGQSERRPPRVEPIAPGPPGQRPSTPRKFRSLSFSCAAGKAIARRSCYGRKGAREESLVGSPI
jgi:hypothetical protein